MKLDSFLNTTRSELESALQQTFNKAASATLRHAIHYSLLDGGKRLRPALVKAAAQVAGNDTPLWLVPAQALEMIHVYSLIHDDLPAMDNDDLRRGKPTNHKQFNEATAILAGDALQSEAFYLIAREQGLNDAQARAMTLALSSAAGASGMVAGQMIDLESEHQTLTLTQLADLHRLKTGALIKAALQLGAQCNATLDAALFTGLNDYGDAIGLAFQITDDILDVTSSTEVLGKPQGSDLAAEKSTYVSLLGLEGARQQANEQHQRATQALQSLNLTEESVLWQLADYVIQRNH
ncbi:polyprenyl synthetase family protein [Reinekea sp. G2M2-21]|uniref:polyprenyl synthetase family protein n=1 Tax=Reinekea sp. G2M2-21 TaxID=2788942 RepID=UPI0018AA90DB|nr:farnesyl diphosphate synthase [Reinekea sp. G2M2-21]